MKETLFEENPNPEARIAFVMWTPFHYWVYKNIARHLSEAEFIVCDTWFCPISERGTAHIEEMIGFLSGKKVYWRVLTELVNRPVIEEFFQRYEIIVAVFSWPPLSAASFPEWFSKKKSVRVMYGMAKGLVTFAPWSAYFDITLSYGSYAHQYLGLMSESHIVGNPKFDDWFNHALDWDGIERIKKDLDPGKKNILYLPTHSNISSLRTFGESVRALNPQYNLLIKFHFLNKLIERESVEKLYKDSCVHIFDEREDILSLLYLADVVISDSSSATIEALLADKPLVILDTLKDPAVASRHKNTEEFNGFWHSGGLIYSQGVGEKLKEITKKVGSVVETPNAGDLQTAIENAVKFLPNMVEERNQLRKIIYAFNDGKCGERAASVIREFISREKPEPPLLGMAIRAHHSNTLKNQRIKIYKLINILAKKKQEIRLLREKLSYQMKEAEIYRAIRREKSLIKKILLILRHFLL